MMKSPLLRTVLALAALTSVPAAAATEPRWEINLDMSAERAGDGDSLALSTPEAEAIYQWSERLHLTAAGGWLHAHPAQQRNAHGWGAGTAGFKWIMASNSEQRWSVAFWPQYAARLSSSSVRNGLASPHRAIALPLEIKFPALGFDVEVISGPGYSRDGHTWDAELKLIRACLPRTDCTLVLERSFARDDSGLTRLLPGVEWLLTGSVIVKAGLGRDIGPRSRGPSKMAFMLGLKLLY